MQDVAYALGFLVLISIFLFCAATLHEISQALESIAKYFGGPKTINMEGPMKIKLVKDEDEHGNG